MRQHSTPLLNSISTQDVTHEPGTPLFSAENVSVRFGDTLALHDLSFVLDAGKQVAVVGPNGAGKSTLFEVMAGEIKPTTGSVQLYGARPADHLCIAYVPQRKALDWNFPVSVEDVVMMGRTGKIGLFRWPRRRDWDIVHQSLAQVNGLHLARKQIGELSGGQQQRIFIARALAQEAELLLLDEPLAGLDMPSQEQFFTLLETVRQNGITTIVATHDLNLAASRFDVVMLLNGTVVAFGEPQAVLTAANLATAYGAHLHTSADSSGQLIIADSCCDD